jgi:hypothetical protein
VRGGCLKNVRFCYTPLSPAKSRLSRLQICNKTHTKIKDSILDIFGEFWYIVYRYLTIMTVAQKNEQKKRLLKAKIAVALQNELGRTPKKEEIEQTFLLARVLYKAVLGLHYKREEQKKSGQLAIF